MTLKSNLPAFIAQERYTSEVLDAIQVEIDKILIELSKLLLECCISTCTLSGLQRYETDYAIETTAGFSIDERKKAVINKMLAKRTLTFSELCRLIKRNIDNKQFYISNFARDYKFKIMLTDEAYMQKIYNAIFKARPAHLIFEIELVSKEKKCGTFFCNGHVI